MKTIKTIEEKLLGKLYCFCDGGDDSGSDSDTGGSTHPGRPGGESNERGNRSDRGDGNDFSDGRSGSDDEGFFTGTFDDPGEPGFTGPSYAGQTGFDSRGDYYGFDDIGTEQELDRITDQFNQLDDLYNTSYGGLLGTSIGAQRSYIAMDATGSLRGYDPRGERVGVEGAQFAARTQGLYGVAGEIGRTAPQYSTGITGSIEKIGANISNAIGSRFGTPEMQDYVVGMQSGYIGKVTEDYSATDLIGNVIGLAVPGGAQVDRALTTDITGRGMGEREFQYADTIFGESVGLPTPEEAEAQRAAQRAAAEAERARGDSQLTARGVVDPAYAASIAAASPRSRLLGGFLSNLGFNAIAPVVRPNLTNTIRFYGSRYFKEGGKVTKKAVGGSADKYDKQMLGALSEQRRPVLDPVEVKKNPEAFMRDPVKARNAQELAKIYGYNQDIMDMARKPLQAQEGMQVGQPEQEPSGDGPVGFVGSRKPETISEAKTVADDVPLDVEEGTFVINAAAVEFAGSDDIKKMLLEAIDEARKQGVDISGDENKIDREKAVSLLVSEGEVIVPPLLAKIIGYDKLNKINDRGKPEVEERVEENGQSPEAEALDEEPMQPENPAEGMGMEQGGFAIRGQGSTRESEGSESKQANLEAEYKGEGFTAKPRVNYSESTNTQNFPDGAVLNEKGKNIGFAVDGEMFLKDDKSLRAGFEKQTSNFEGRVDLPAEYGGETIEFGGGSKLKRYNMGATFGPVDVDLSKTQTPGDDVLAGSVRYRFSEDGDVTLEATENGRSGRIGLNYRF